jgi:pimeloyl-ACP methyl ester carboxylesterase
LIRRGLLLLALMSGLVVVVLTILFQRPRQALPVGESQPELYSGALVSSAAFYPASLSWAALYQVGADLPSAPGWEIRYNAAWALARLGSDKIPWPLFREMLDEKRQMRNFRAQLEDGRTVPDEAKARETVLIALRSLADWHAKQKELQRTQVPVEVQTGVYPLVDQLAASPIAQLKFQAEKTRSTFIR